MVDNLSSDTLRKYSFSLREKLFPSLLHRIGSVPVEVTITTKYICGSAGVLLLNERMVALKAPRHVLFLVSYPIIISEGVSASPWYAIFVFSRIVFLKISVSFWQFFCKTVEETEEEIETGASAFCEGSSSFFKAFCIALGFRCADEEEGSVTVFEAV